MIGTNNSGYRSDPPEHTAAGVRAIDQPRTLHCHAAATRGIPHQRNDAVNQQIAGFADASSIWIWPPTLPTPTQTAASAFDQYVHPNEAGYAVWAAHFGSGR